MVSRHQGVQPARFNQALLSFVGFGCTTYLLALRLVGRADVTVGRAERDSVVGSRRFHSA